MDELLKRYPQLKCCADSISEACELFVKTYKNGGKVLLCGNGGSAADCEHIVGELMKGFMLKRPVADKFISEPMRSGLQGALPAISLPSQCAILSAFCNDVDPEMIYAQLAYGYLKGNDLMFGISTSGNSKNVVNAIRIAKCMNVKTLVLTGARNSALSDLSDVSICVPETETYKVQELHLPVYHYICATVEKIFFE